MRDENYYSAFFFERRVVIAGYVLQPFSVGHLQLLQAVQSPFLASGGDINAPSLAAALRICSSRYPYALTGRASIVDQWRLCRMALSARRFLRCADQFANYVIGAVNARPKFWTVETGPSVRQGGGKRPLYPAPSPLVLACTLMQMGFTEQAAWDCPYQRAEWYAAHYAQSAGADISFFLESRIKLPPKSGNGSNA